MTNKNSKTNGRSAISPIQHIGRMDAARWADVFGSMLPSDDVRIAVTDRRQPAAVRQPTIYEALKTQLQREPTHRELCDDVKRILASVRR
jgi:hypothetical protein